MTFVVHFKSGKTRTITGPDDVTFTQFIAKEFGVPHEDGKKTGYIPQWSLYNGLAINWDSIEFVEEAKQ